MEKQALAVREQQWYQTITTAKQSGQSIKSWCAENGVPLSSFYSWQRKMRSALLRQESVQFEELSPSSPKTAAIPPTQITLRIFIFPRFEIAQECFQYVLLRMFLFPQNLQSEHSLSG